jgi:tRNA nucleotidyltransferase/poly(A) polymerase
MKYIRERNQFKFNITLPKVVKLINSIFEKGGYKLYLVGGAVRDFIDGRKPKDFDVATNATPKEVVEMFSEIFGIKKEKANEYILNNKWRINLQGESFAVVVIYIPGEREGIEIASFNTRHDGKIVVDGVTLEQDAERRDLTFNALYYDISKGEVIDLVGGVDDLKNKKVRMVGDPDERIKEDPLRIQRIFRFACRYDSVMDEETKKAINGNKDLYRNSTPERPNGVSQERIIQEFVKSFKTSPDFTTYLGFINEFKMWDILFPGISFGTFDISKYTSTNKLSICLSQILINEGMDIFKSIMVNEWKFPKDITQETSLFVEMTRLEMSKKAVNLKMRKERFNISDKITKEFINLMGLNDKEIIKSFLKFDPTIDSKKLMDKNGIENNNGKIKNPSKDGKKLGMLISKERINNFNSL